MQEVEQGYEKTRFRVLVDVDLCCGICLSVLNEPVQCANNEHHFCRPCLTRHMQEDQTCPVCKDDLSHETMKRPCRFITNNLAKLDICCDSKGCRQYVSLESLRSHKESCVFALVACPNNHCTDMVQRKDMRLHQMFLCEYRQIKCQSCIETREQLKTVLDSKQTPQAINHTEYEIVVVGGRNNRLRLSSVERYSSITRQWTAWESMSEPRAAASVFVYEGQVFVSGGRNHDRKDCNTIYYIKDDEHWSVFPARLPIECSGHKTTVYKDRLIVVGGGNNGVISNSIYQVLLVPPFTHRHICTMPESTYFHGCECFGTKVFILGGSSTATKNYLSSVMKYDIQKKTCTRISTLPFLIGCMATVRRGNDLIVFGGCNEKDEVLKSVFVYNTKTGTITRLPDMKYRRRGCTAVMVGNKAVVMGGIDEQGKYLGLVEAFNFEQYCWEELPSMSEPRAFASSAEWKGTLVLD